MVDYFFKNMIHERILPFPQVPFGVFPGENRPVDSVVTKEVSTFHNPVAVSIAKAVGNYRLATQRGQRNAALQQALAICEGNYPHQYRLLRQYLADSITKVSDLAVGNHTIGSYRELDQTVTREYAPPLNTRLYFLFEAHAVYTEEQREEVRERLRKRFAGFFTKEGRNIYFYEDSAQDKRKTEVFRRAVRKFGSFLKAGCFYDLYVASGRTEPTDNQFNLVYQEMINQPVTHPHFDYSRVVYEVLDEFTADRYKIELVMEEAKIQRKPDYADLRRYSPKSAEELKLHIVRSIEYNTAREQADAKQLNDMVYETARDEQTNIFVVRGSAHETLMKVLPKRLIPVSQTEVGVYARRQNEAEIVFDRKYVDVYRRVQKGEVVMDTEYEELWADLIALQ